MPLPNTKQLALGSETGNPDAINNFLREIVERMNAIFDPKSAIQSGMYSAFGNNILTRTANQGIDLVSDTVSSIFGSKEDEQKDPLLSAIEKQTEAITELATNIDSKTESTDSVLNLIDDDLIKMRLDMKENHIGDKSQANMQISILTDIKGLLESTSPNSIDVAEKEATQDYSARQPLDRSTSIYEQKNPSSIDYALIDSLPEIKEQNNTESDSDGRSNTVIQNVEPTTESDSAITKTVDSDAKKLSDSDSDVRSNTVIQTVEPTTESDSAITKTVDSDAKKLSDSDSDVRSNTVIQNVEPTTESDSAITKTVDSDAKKLSDSDGRSNTVIQNVEPTTEQTDDLKKETPSKFIDKKLSNKTDETKTPTFSILQKILNVLMSIDKSIEKLSKNGPISTRESDIEAIRVKNAALKQATVVQDIKEGEKNNKFDFTRLFTGLFDLDANLMGLNKVFKMAVDAIKFGITGIVGAFSLLKGGIASLIKWITDLLKGRGKGATDSIPDVDMPNKKPSPTSKPTSIGKSIVRGGINLLKSAAPVAIATGVGAALYAGTEWAKSAKLTDEEGELTTTGKIIDTAQKALGSQGVKPLTGLTGAEKIASEADTGWLDLFGTKKAAYKKKYEASFELGTKYTPEEAEALKKHFDIAVPEGNIKKAIDAPNIQQIEVAQKDLKQAEDDKKNQTTKHSVPVVVANNNSVTNNQTVLPTRTIVENNERSYQRYLNNMLTTPR